MDNEYVPIGWNGQASFRVFTGTVPAAGSGATQVVEANSRRTALILGQVSSGTTHWIMGGGDTGVGLPVGTNSGPLVLTRHQHGGLVTRSWGVAHSAGGSLSVAYAEAFE